ncbi:chemotaxis protein CheW [bacterium]|nr:chemotaxis protein CheW [bacterium]MBU1994609.1 chemotaxis protein CheW [bacterium]
MQIQEIIIINNGAQSYGISTQFINQVSRVPALMPLPLRPFGVRGLCSVGGNIVSIVDMNLLLDMNAVEYDAPSSRLVSFNGVYASHAFLVNQVDNIVEVNQKDTEYLDNNDELLAVYKYEDSLIQIVSLDFLLSKIKKVAITSKEIKKGKSETKISLEEKSSRFLIFAMANERFALNIDYLREIIMADVSFTEITGSSSEILGLINLRNELITVLDLQTYYGFEHTLSYKNRILIVSHGDKTIGLLVDGIIDIKNILAKNIEYMSENFEDEKISGVIHDGKNLISFFDATVLDKLFAKNRKFIDAKASIYAMDKSADIALEVIIFELANKEYAFKIENVAEIIDIVKPTEIAYTNKFIDGIINIRGQIITIFSLYKKLNIPKNIHEGCKIIICNINETKIGFIVESVSDILNIHKNEIREQNDSLFTNVLHLEDGKRLVLCMDIDEILSIKGQA